MAIIKISDEWRVSGDEHQWMVERFRGMRKGRKTEEMEPVWEFVTSHQTLEGAARSLAMRQLRTADVEGVAAVLDMWQSITTEIDAAFIEWRVEVA